MPVATSDDAALRALIDAFVEGWNRADGPSCARPFAADADFTAINGLHAVGRDLIARGHDEILSTIFRGTKLASTVESIRFLRPDVALLNVSFALRKEDGSPVFGIESTSCGVVATKDQGAWSISVFRNMVPFARPVAGPLEREIMVQKSA